MVDHDLRARIQQNAREYARVHFNETRTDGEWMEQIDSLAPRQTAEPARSGGAAPWKTAFGLAAHAGRMSAKAMPMLWRNGIRDTGRRAYGYLAGFAQVLQWEFHRWRLQQRVSSHK